MGSMRKSRLSKYKQGRLVEHFVAGPTARTAASLCGVNRKTAALYFLRLREIIAYELEAGSNNMCGGEVEVDESYFGGRRKGKRGRGAAGKIPVFGILNWHIKKGWEGLHQDYPGRCLGDVDPDY